MAGVIYALLCFFLCVFLTVCRVVLVFFKCGINLTSFLSKSRFISLLLFIHLFSFFLLIKHLFSHETVQVSFRFRLNILFVCFVSCAEIVG